MGTYFAPPFDRFENVMFFVVVRRIATNFLILSSYKGRFGPLSSPTPPLPLSLSPHLLFFPFGPLFGSFIRGRGLSKFIDRVLIRVPSTRIHGIFRSLSAADGLQVSIGPDLLLSRSSL